VQWLYERVLRAGDHCIDVGANEGRHLFPMAKRISPGGKVYAFEPIPGMVEELRGKVSRLGLDATVELHACAAAHEDGESDFMFAVDCPAYSGLRERRYDFATRVEPIRVQVRRLDTVLGHLERLRYVKIDVEGGEWGVIQGAAGLITRLRPVVSFEFGASGYERYGTDPGDVWDFFATREYMLRDIRGRVLRDREHLRESSRTEEVWDYAAIPRELERESKEYFGWRARAARFLPRAVLRF
jgi:FkbM family methyltransferase